MPRPHRPPIGLRVSRTARTISRAFDDTLVQAGGSLPTWLIFISLKARPQSNQRELAEAVGIRGATLTHHLNALESDGLLTRRRDPANRRTHIVELTDEGEALFRRLREAASAFDRRLRDGLADQDFERLERLLDRMHDNATGNAAAANLTSTAESRGAAESPPERQWGTS